MCVLDTRIRFCAAVLPDLNRCYHTHQVCTHVCMYALGTRLSFGWQKNINIQLLIPEESSSRSVTPLASCCQAPSSRGGSEGIASEIGWIGSRRGIPSSDGKLGIFGWYTGTRGGGGRGITRERSGRRAGEGKNISVLVSPSSSRPWRSQTREKRLLSVIKGVYLENRNTQKYDWKNTLLLMLYCLGIASS